MLVLPINLVLGSDARDFLVFCRWILITWLFWGGSCNAANVTGFSVGSSGLFNASVATGLLAALNSALLFVLCHPHLALRLACSLSSTVHSV